MAESEISVGGFVSRLFAIKHKEISQTELLRYGHFRGWLEDCDERHPETLLNRQTAARIIHQFMVVELGVPDIADISGAEKLRDLYTCRVCANHVAQVYLRGIMGAREIDGVDSSVSVGTGAAQSVLIFNHLGRVTQSEAREAMEGLRSKQPQRVSELCERTIEDAERE